MHLLRAIQERSRQWLLLNSIKTQDVASAATARVASLPAASQVGMNAGPESGIVGKLSNIISRCQLPQLKKKKKANDNSK